MRPLQLIGAIGTGCVVLFVLLAGAAKLVDLAEFRRSIESLGIVPDAATPYVALVIAWIEVLAGLAWFCGLGKRVAIMVIVLLLLVFTSVFGILLAIGERPTCACLGLLARYIVLHNEGMSVVLRNFGLLTTLGIGVWLSRSSVRATHSDASSGNDTNANVLPQVPRGFSIIEVLIVIVIIGSLLSIALPALSRTRFASRRSVSEINLRSHTQIMMTYTSDFKEYFPLFMDPKASLTVLRSDNVELALSYFDAHVYWNFGIGPRYYGSAFNKVFFSPAIRADMNAHYYYSCTFVARPEYWNPSTRTDGRGQWNGTRISDVTFPSAKILLSDQTPIYELLLRRTTPSETILKRWPWTAIVTVDGAVRRVQDNEILPGYPTSDGPIQSLHTGGPTNDGMHTIDGVRGRDLAR
ncbi:MAG TPA: MauE/DoxX family redox-associated membrane protein [Phycisphaerales bacterium]